MPKIENLKQGNTITMKKIFKNAINITAPDKTEFYEPAKLLLLFCIY